MRLGFTTCMEMFGNGVSILGTTIMKKHPVTIAVGMPLMIPDVRSFAVVHGSAIRRSAVPLAVTSAISSSATTTSLGFVLSASLREDRLSPDPPSPFGKGEHEWEVEWE